MFHKNLTYYRLKKAMTKNELANRAQVSPMAITHYENGHRKPSMDVMKRLALALDVRVADFLAVRKEDLILVHGDFRKKSSLSKMQKDYIRASVEEYLNRFMTLVEIMGSHVLPDAPALGVLEWDADSEASALLLREHLQLAPEGPIDDLVEILENKGILFYQCEVEHDNFSGTNGLIDGRPFVVVNKKMSPERNRSTIAHELAHLMFRWPEGMPESDIERQVTAISGAFLFPKSDAIRELGVRRSSAAKDMYLVAREYGISMYMLVKRASILGILTHQQEKAFYVEADSRGWRTKEPVRIPQERPVLFEQLVYRAINEEEISVQKGAELLKIPYDEVQSRCCFCGDERWII